MGKITIRTDSDEAIFFYRYSGVSVGGEHRLSSRRFLLFPDYFVQCFRTMHIRDSEKKDYSVEGFLRRFPVTESVSNEIKTILERYRGLHLENYGFDSGDSFQSKEFDISIHGWAADGMPDIKEIWEILEKESGIEKRSQSDGYGPAIFLAEYEDHFWNPEEVGLDKKNHECPRDARDPSWRF
jgi:hypothetical protein